ncbi:MAG: 30S ribosomal protein S2 [bacterium]|nr:30S ribosomal protein S2 [bacterium]
MATVNVDIKQLLEAGAHFGHKTSRWHPKMAEYIHSKKEGSHIIDLTKTVSALNESLKFIEGEVAKGKQVLVVGTKRQARDVVKKIAADTGMPYVAERWLGGMLTNTNTMNVRLKHLRDTEIEMDSGALENKLNKLELQRVQEELDLMNYNYGGIKEMHAKPGVMFVFDVIHDVNAVREANKLGIPVVALVDTNADPRPIPHPIPCNDDAVKTVELIGEYLTQAILAGKAKVKEVTAEEAKKEAKDPAKAIATASDKDPANKIASSAASAKNPAKAIATAK